MRRLGAPSLVLALAVMAAGCTDPSAAPPRPLSVTPDRGAASLPVAIVIRGSGFGARVSTDFTEQAPSTLDARFSAWLGTVPLLDVRLRSDGTLGATVPAGLTVGLHALRVVNPEGREGLLPDAYLALADADSAALVARYRVDPVGPQRAWAPFRVSVTALDAAGAPVTSFNGAVSLTDLTGTAVPTALARFAGGAWTGDVEVRSAHPADVLRVVDALGNAGASAPFPVSPSPAAALRFTTPPLTTTAGACSGAAQPLTVELLDAFGAPTLAGADVALSATTAPAGPVELFGDAGCASALSRPAIPAGSQSATFFLRATRAGGATLEVAAPSLATAAQPLVVLAGPPATLAFVAAAPTVIAGTCAQATVEVRDAWGNVVLGAPTPIALASDPASALTFHADAASCDAVPVPGVTTSATTGRADLWFRGTLAQPVRITATAGAASATLDRTVVPAPPDHLAFSSPEQHDVVAGAPSGPVTLQSRDAFENPSPVPSDTPIALSAAPGTGFTFCRDAGCTSTFAPGAGSITLAAGLSAATVFFQPTAVGPVTIAASAPGWAVVSQAETVIGGPADHFAWDVIPSPRALGRPFSVRVVALDRLGNIASSFSGTAVLSVVMGAPIAPLSCSTGCTSGLTTSAFSGGVWSGTVSMQAPTSPTAGTPDRRLAATAGAITGTSNLFELIGAPNRSPPTAELTATPAVALVGAPVTFDASASSDYQTATADLEVAWDLEGAASGAPPATGWSTWATAPKTVSHVFTAPGTYSVRVAVRDADGDLGFASATVVVRASSADRLCLVNVAEADLDKDDAGAATSCAGAASAGDGLLSLAEALRLAVDGDTIAFAPAIRTIATGTPYAFTKGVQVVAPGVALTGSAITVGSKAGITVPGTTIVGLEVSGGGVTVPNGMTAIFREARLHDFSGIVARGFVTLEHVRMSGCAGACFQKIDFAGPDLVTILYSDFRGAGAGTAVTFTACAKKLVLHAQSNVFAGFATAIAFACDGSTSVVDNTFDANGTGIAYGASSGHVLRNNVFTNQSTAAATGGSAAFTTQSHHLLWQNASDGCLAVDASTLTSDPLFVLPTHGDLRLQPGSPAVDSAADFALDASLKLSLNLVEAFPSPSAFRWLGAGPDRGGLESY
jgi:plastocyanin